MFSKKEAARLHVHEWLALLTICSLLGTFTLINLRNDSGVVYTVRDRAHYLVDQQIEVYVEGAVEEEVRLVVTKGTTVQEVLQKVTLLPEADLSKMKMASKVRRGQKIKVPFTKKKK